MKHRLALLICVGCSLIAAGAHAQGAYLSEVRLFATNFCPMGWAAANGQLLPIRLNQALFALIGTSFGGDGQTTFALPNLQNRAPIGVGPSIALGTVAGAQVVRIDPTANKAGPSVTVQTPTLSMTWCIATVGIFPPRN